MEKTYYCSSVCIKYNIIEKWSLKKKYLVRRGQQFILFVIILYTYNNIITNEYNRETFFFFFRTNRLMSAMQSDGSVKPRPHTFRLVFYRPVRVVKIRIYYVNRWTDFSSKMKYLFPPVSILFNKILHE